MTARQEYEERCCRELEKIRRKKQELSCGGQSGCENRQELSAWKALEELERCCEDNLLVLRQRENRRVISYTQKDREGRQRENTLLYLAADFQNRKDNTANRRRVAEEIRRIMDRELEPEVREVLVRVFAGESRSQIAADLAAEPSAVTRKYQKGIRLLKKYCGYLEAYLR